MYGGRVSPIGFYNAGGWTRDCGELPADDLVLDGRRHSDPAMWHRAQRDRTSSMIEMETNDVSLFRVQDT
jgi:hypothetical protein